MSEPVTDGTPAIPAPDPEPGPQRHYNPVHCGPKSKVEVTICRPKEYGSSFPQG